MKALKIVNNHFKPCATFIQATTMLNENTQYGFINKTTLLMINPIK